MSIPPKVFLSHTTRDQRDYDLAHKLADGLKSRGAQVWIAPDSIPPGEHWAEHIVSGVMEQCTHFLVILSAASTTAEWVLEEIKLAKQRHQQDNTFKILPLSVGKVGNYRNVEFVNQFQWIPYHDNFQSQLEAVAKAVGLRPIVHPPRPPTAADDFVGREYVFDAIEAFLNRERNGYFIIEGDPGAGKSALLAEFVRRTGCIAHFNIRTQGVNTAVQFVESVCRQIISRFGLPYASLPADATRDGAFLSQLLNEASQQLDAGERLIVAVDALDEVELKGHPAGVNILYLPPMLPEKIYFVMTRRQVGIPFTVHTPQELYDFNQHLGETLQDVKSYIGRAADQDPLKNWLAKQSISEDAFVSKLAEKSEGNFMYLRYVLPEIEKGTYGDFSIEKLPTGLEGYYNDHWYRMGMIADPLPRVKLRIVYVICEARQPISAKMISDFADDDMLHVDLLDVTQVLKEWDQFLHEQESEYGKLYSVYHSSFRDFLHRQDIVEATGERIQDINAVIANQLLSDLGLLDNE